MKKSSLIILVFLFLFTNLYSEEPNQLKTGVGFMFGEPTGLSGKFWIGETNAFAGGLGWHFVGPNDGFSLHLDYLYHIDNTLQTNIRFPLYYGFGARIREEGNDFGLGFRGVGGILFYPDELPIDIFFEVVPVFVLLPSTDLELDLALGARYYFK